MAAAQNTPGQHRGMDWCGFAGFRASKAPMQAYAAELGATMQLQVQMPRRQPAPADIVEEYTYTRHFVAIDDPVRLLEILPGLPADKNHTYEIILKDKPCKLCVDFDGTDGLPACFASKQDFTSRVQDVLTDIFLTEFGVQLPAESFVWVFTDYPVKFRAHLVEHHIMPDGRILCLPQHNPTHATHDGARHFYNRLVQVMPELEQHALINGSIYTRDREMRLPGATKPPKPGVRMDTWTPNTACIATNHSLADAMVSYFAGRTPHVLQLPTVERQQASMRTTAARKGSAAPPSGVSYSEGEERMLELILQQHPTADMQRLSGKNVWDRDNAPRCNHTDRTEECWCGKAHKSNNYAAWFAGSQAFVHAFGCWRTFRIGSLTDDFSAAGDVEVHCRYLARRRQDNLTALVGGQQTLHRYMSTTCTDADTTSLNTELDKLMGMHTHVLGIQSSMGTGKTCLLLNLVQELEEVHRAKRVLIITYRQSLSLHMLSDLQALGFENYLDAKEHKADLSAADMAIVQLDSIAMVCRRGRIIPQYNLVVLDEVESTLHHTTAKTHRERQATTFRTFCSIVKASKRVLAMDAFFRAETRAFFKSLQLHAHVVRNTWRPQPRTMVFTNDQQEWVEKLVQALAAGENVAVASMSSNMLHSLKQHLVTELALLKEDEVLLYDSAADDALKKRVQFVNSDWIIKRLVMWSPCIEAGVNFDQQHFHSLFLHLCNSTTPLGLMQMSGRIRQLENSTVHCMCKGLSWQGAAEEFTPADAVNHIRWQENLTWPEGFHAELPCDEEPLEPALQTAVQPP
ncbi:hypothetical protein OEZ85_003903 [Tetradesmus obliquus]|uniref:Replication origin-binding protein domain-containing protein n=1 Tax=Tetradesmus obliquus TaxID=3088 RepID=A0ABY8UF50_TETOB|nr:hypothetical protein OEZ85_003903 [Tetradesmus obliquus]